MLRMNALNFLFGGAAALIVNTISNGLTPLFVQGATTSGAACRAPRRRSRARTVTPYIGTW
jgi:hypothetical protein